MAAAAKQRASLTAKWMVALQSLKAVPGAAADRSLPKKTLHYMASQAEVDCTAAEYNYSLNPMEIDWSMLQSSPQLEPVLGLVVQKLQIPQHICKAVAAILPIPFTFHMSAELLFHLVSIIRAAEEHDSGTEGPSTPARSLTLAVSTQIAASGLLQQLPAALKTAQQQLQTLKPRGWCGVPCHFCNRGPSNEATLAADAGAHSPQNGFLTVCTQLLKFWPGTLGPFGSAAMTAVLLPAAQLALSSLQYVCRQAGELHTTSSSSSKGSKGSSGSSGSSSSPAPALVELGRAALDYCAALTRTASAVKERQNSPGAADFPEHAKDLLSSPDMMAALVVFINADVYGQHDHDSVTAASAPVDFDPANFDLMRLLHMQAPVTPDGNLPAAAWQQVCARERQLKPGQELLPPLQAELLATLGCNSKGFLWLAPVWKHRQRTWCIYSATLPVIAMIASNMQARLRSSNGAASSRTSLVPEAAAVRQLYLLPALMLRRELHQQRARGSVDDGPWRGVNIVRACTSCVPLLDYWNELHELVSPTRRAAAGGSAAAAAAGGAAGAAAGEQLDIQLGPILLEILDLVTHLLLGTMQNTQPGNSSSSSSSSSLRGGRSSSSAGARYDPWDPSPGAAANVLSCVIAVLLPLATRSVLAQEASNNSSDNKILSATWVPLLLRLTTALEQGMRFEAHSGVSRAELEGVVGGIAGQIAKDAPGWSSSWLASFLLLSPLAHGTYGWMYAAGETQPEDQPQVALLEWMLDNTSPEQLPAAQQRALSLLCTAAKVGVSAANSKQLMNVHLACRGMLSTAEGVLTQLLTQQSAGSVTASVSAAGAAATPGGSSKTSGSAAAAAAAGGHSTADTVPTDAVMSWLSFLGRCFLQASQQMCSSTQQRAAGLDISSSATQQDARERFKVASREMHSVFALGARELPRCILWVAVLLAAAARQPNKPLPQPKPVQRLAPAEGASSCPPPEKLDARFRVAAPERQLLEGAGRGLAGHCSSMGVDLSAVQISTWALADAAAAASAVFSSGFALSYLASAGQLNGDVPLAMAKKTVLDMGLTEKQALEALEHPVCGTRGLVEITAAGLLFSPAGQACMQQLNAAGLALSALPTAATCNNPQCSNLSGVSERGGSCKACSACHLAVYCQRSCQKQHWDVHKPVCKAIQAAAAAAAGHQQLQLQWRHKSGYKQEETAACV